jgi:signal transduction histidine kinase
VRLRTRLSLLFALFAAAPLLATLAPVGLALSRALEREQADRLEAARRALEAELARLGAEAAAGVRDVATRRDLAALASALTEGLAAPPDAAARLEAWGAARGLGVLALVDGDGRVVASAHLPGRAGDLDPDLSAALGAAPAGLAIPAIVARAHGPELERVAALLAWDGVPGSGLRLVGGVALDAPLAIRLAAVAGGEVSVLGAGGERLAGAQAPGPTPADGLSSWLGRLGTDLASASPGRELALGDPAAPVARLELRVAAEGLLAARGRVLLAAAVSLLVATLAAALGGRLVAARITGPVERLRAAAARVAVGDLSARVAGTAGGEVGELVEAFNAMTAELERGRARLAAAERVAAWREVARRLAHEIKNPLTPIAMSVETLRDAGDRPDRDEVVEEATRAIGEEVRRLKRIVDEFGRFARLPAPEPRPTDPAELVQAVLALWPAPPPGVTIERSVEPGLPAVRLDRDQLTQVLLNLVTNALEAMPGGGRLRVSAWRSGGEVALQVSDTGIGFDPAEVDRLFQPYQTTKAGGTGLGLAIAERIVQEHGGRIEATGRPGAGATFTVLLPISGPASP